MNSQHFSTPDPTPRGNTSAQDLQLELVRHYADVLRMLTERIPTLGPPATSAAAPPPVQEAQLEETPASWEEASGYLHARDFRREEVVHLWLQLCYVLGTHVLVGLAVTIQGYRRIAGVTHIIHHEFSQGYKMRLWLCGVRISGVSRNLRVRLPDWDYKRDDFRIFSGWER